MSKYIKTLIGTRPLNTKDKKALASFVKNSKRIGKKLQTILMIFLWQKKTNKSNSYSTNNYKIGIKTNNGNYYGLIIGINKKDNYICTVLKNTKNGVEAFVDERGKKDKKKNPAMMPSSHPTAPVEQMPNSDVSHSQGSDNIIAYIKEQLNPSEQTKILYQSAVTAGAETSAEISDAQKEWKEKGTDSKYFKKWFGDSKVVDENGHDTVLHSEKEHTLTSNE